MMTTTEIDLTIQRLADADHVPEDDQFFDWVTTALSGFCDKAEITIRLVDESESAELNENYRKKKGPTNILSFTYERGEALFGDMVICTSLVEAEAKAQQITPLSHWAHLVIHGCYHLLGYDHETEADAKIMQSLEIAALAKHHFANPYAVSAGESEL